MSRSLTRAWAPVPLKGPSSRITPRFASTSRAASFTGIGSVLVSITIVPRFAEAASSAATSAKARAEGSDVMMMPDRLATSRGLRAATPPARLCSARRRGTTSKPATRNPARARFADIAEPMIPSPIIPTDCCAISIPPRLGILTIAGLRPAADRQVARRDVGLVFALDRHFVRRAGVAAYPGNGDDGRVFHDGRAKAEDLAEDGAIRLVAERNVDGAPLDSHRADEVVDDLVGDGQTGGGVVDWESLQDGPRQGDRRFGEVGERQGLGDLIPYELVLISGNRHQRQNGHDPDHDHHFNEGETAGAHGRGRVYPAFGTDENTLLSRPQPSGIEQKWRGFWSAWTSAALSPTVWRSIATAASPRRNLLPPRPISPRACSPRCASRPSGSGSRSSSSAARSRCSPTAPPSARTRLSRGRARASA